MSNNLIKSSKSYEIFVKGDRALFSNPITKISGEKCSYIVPTYSALVGIIESIYYKPTFRIFIDKVRVMNKIEMESYGTRVPHFSDNKNDLSIYTYIKNPYYQITFHYEWDLLRPDLTNDRNYQKHDNIFKRSIISGGRRNVYLGVSECAADIGFENFGCGTSYYDKSGEMIIGVMHHSIDYADSTDKEPEKLLWLCKMENGIINFPRPEECIIRNTMKKTKKKRRNANELDK